MTVSAELRAQVAARASGRCEYRLIHEEDASFAHEVDHVVSLKHGGETNDHNLAYACFICNRYKGSDLGSLSQTGDLIRFFNPRTQGWEEHFAIRGPIIEPLSPEGEVTARMFKFNSAQRVQERRTLQRLGRYLEQAHK